jgi:hypothetical protein
MLKRVYEYLSDIRYYYKKTAKFILINFSAILVFIFIFIVLNLYYIYFEPHVALAYYWMLEQFEIMPASRYNIHPEVIEAYKKFINYSLQLNLICWSPENNYIHIFYQVHIAGFDENLDADIKVCLYDESHKNELMAIEFKFVEWLVNSKMGRMFPHTHNYNFINNFIAGKDIITNILVFPANMTCKILILAGDLKKNEFIQFNIDGVYKTFYEIVRERCIARNPSRAVFVKNLIDSVAFVLDDILYWLQLRYDISIDLTFIKDYNLYLYKNELVELKHTFIKAGWVLNRVVVFCINDLDKDFFFVRQAGVLPFEFSNYLCFLIETKHSRILPFFWATDIFVIGNIADEILEIIDIKFSNKEWCEVPKNLQINLHSAACFLQNSINTLDIALNSDDEIVTLHKKELTDLRDETVLILDRLLEAKLKIEQRHNVLIFDKIDLDLEIQNKKLKKQLFEGCMFEYTTNSAKLADIASDDLQAIWGKYSSNIIHEYCIDEAHYEEWKLAYLKKYGLKHLKYAYYFEAYW